MIRHIVLIDSKQGIAKNGDQPVHLKIDGAYFGEKTQLFGGNVLMGRALYEMIGALKGRQNFVATRHADPLNGATLVPDLVSFVQDFKQDLWIVGGAEIYDQTIAYADELYITKLDHDFDCDKFYPEYESSFGLVSESETQHENDLDYTFCVYQRKLA